MFFCKGPTSLPVEGKTESVFPVCCPPLHALIPSPVTQLLAHSNTWVLVPLNCQAMASWSLVKIKCSICSCQKMPNTLSPQNLCTVHYCTFRLFTAVCQDSLRKQLAGLGWNCSRTIFVRGLGGRDFMGCALSHLEKQLILRHRYSSCIITLCIIR